MKVVSHQIRIDVQSDLQVNNAMIVSFQLPFSLYKTYAIFEIAMEDFVSGNYPISKHVICLYTNLKLDFFKYQLLLINFYHLLNDY